MKKFELTHNGNTITVENSMTCERLLVNGELQDEMIGLSVQQRLWGKLPAGETIKVSLGGIWAVHCRIFIDSKLMLSE